MLPHFQLNWKCGSKFFTIHYSLFTLHRASASEAATRTTTTEATAEATATRTTTTARTSEATATLSATTATATEAEGTVTSKQVQTIDDVQHSIAGNGIVLRVVTLHG